MMNFFRKHRRNIFIITVVVFVASTFVGFGGYFFGGGGVDTVAIVNGVKIPYQRYNFLYNRSMDSLRQNGTEITPEVIKQVERDVIQELIQDEVFWQEAKKFGITVSDNELSQDIRRFPAFQRDGTFDHRLYYEFLRRVLRTTPREFEEFRRRQIAFFKLRHFIFSSVVIPQEEISQSYREKFPDKKSADWEKEKQEFSQTYKQEVVNGIFNEYLKQLNQTVKIKVLLRS